MADIKIGDVVAINDNAHFKGCLFVVVPWGSDKLPEGTHERWLKPLLPHPALDAGVIAHGGFTHVSRLTLVENEP